MLVRDIMSEDVEVVHFSKKLIVIREIMEWKRVRHVPVVDECHRLLGLVSHRDLLRASISSADSRIAGVERSQHLWSVPIVDVMSTRVETIAPDESVRVAARMLRDGHFGCLPVVSDDEVVGIVTEHDLLALIADVPIENC